MKKRSTTPSVDEGTPITQADIDAGRVAQPKKRIGVHLDTGVIDRFKQMPSERGYPLAKVDGVRIYGLFVVRPLLPEQANGGEWCEK